MRLDGFGLRGVGVLWVLATTACPGDDSGSGDTGDSTGTPATDTSMTMTTTASTTPTTDPSTSTSGEDATTTGEPATSTTSGASTGGSSSDGGSTDTSGSGAESGTTGGGAMECMEGCAVEFACSMDWRTEEACVTACEANLDKAQTFSLFCRFAWEELHACIGTLTCMEYEEYVAAAAFPYPCWQASENLALECAGQ